jgi:HTH-type transcriptional regulator/antitoxin HigA
MTRSTATPYEVRVRAIRTEDDLDWALAQIDRVIDAEPGTREEAFLDVLTTLVEAYEAQHHAIPPPTAIEALQFRMEQNGYGQSELAKVLGSRSRASEVLRGERELSKEMIQRLHREWAIPLESLMN